MEAWLARIDNGQRPWASGAIYLILRDVGGPLILGCAGKRCAGMMPSADREAAAAATVWLHAPSQDYTDWHIDDARKQSRSSPAGSAERLARLWRGITRCVTLGHSMSSIAKIVPQSSFAARPLSFDLAA